MKNVKNFKTFCELNEDASSKTKVAVAEIDVKDVSNGIHIDEEGSVFINNDK